MKMFLLTVLLSFAVGRAWCQTACQDVPSTNDFSPVVMRYTPFMTAQIGPTSTVWDTIITTWFNAVDCRYVTPLRVDENPAAEGPFTTFVRSPTLTVTRVGCMPETTAVTRRDVRGKEQMEIRSAVFVPDQKMQKRRTAAEAIDEAVKITLDTFPPETTSLTVQAYRYLVSVNTAIFAINLVRAGLELNQTCRHLRDPAFQAQLFRTTIDPIQAEDIVCFAENNGLYFSQGTDKVVTYLESLIYAIQARPDYSDDSEDFCWPELIEDSPFLGVDTDGISQYLCPRYIFSTISSSTTRTRTPNISGSATASTSTTPGAGTIIGTGTQASATIAPPPTGGPFANSTSAGGVAVSSGIANGTGISGYNTNTVWATVSETPGPFANSTVAPSEGPTTTNSTASALEPEITSTEVGTTGTIGTISPFSTYSTDVIFPNVTYTSSDVGGISGTGAGSGTVLATGNLPPVPTAISPDIESVASTPTRRPRRWY